MVTKTGMMLGLGETWDEILEAMRLLRAAEIDVLTIGQYLRPSQKHLPLMKYYTPAEFMSLRRIGLEMGFAHVQSGPLVRSSYHAAEQGPRPRDRRRGLTAHASCQIQMTAAPARLLPPIRPICRMTAAGDRNRGLIRRSCGPDLHVANGMDR